MKYLYENRVIGDEHQRLKEVIGERSPLQKYFEHSFDGIKPKNYCGFLSIDDTSYFIIPKIVTANDTNLDIFLYMLLYAYDIKLSNEDIAALNNHQDRIFEVFVRMFADGLLDEFKRGVFRQYITMQENLKVLRGKYLVTQNFHNFYHQNIACEFDEFSMDNSLNRFFLYAIRFFKKYSRYSNLLRCEQILDEVGSVSVDTKRFEIRFDRTNIRYRKSFEVAMILLQKLVPLTGKSGQKSFAFLFDMAEVFEKFVGRLYKEIDPTTRLQMQKSFGSLLLKPDIVTDNMIIDTKYKGVTNRDDLHTHDKYQMFAYGVNFKQPNVMLLYPKHKVDVSEDLVLGKRDDVVYLKMRSLDLQYNSGYDEYIGTMKQRLEEI